LKLTVIFSAVRGCQVIHLWSSWMLSGNTKPDKPN